MKNYLTKYSLIALILIIFYSCSNNTFNNEIRITFIRCNDFSLTYLKETQIKLEEYFYNEFGLIANIEWDDKSEYINSNNRLKADEIINHFSSNHFPTTIVFLPDDIEYNGKGILGLSIHPGNTCVVSTYRLKNKNELWKLAAHEFIHTYFNYSHCPDDNSQCIMKDAKGHVNFSNKFKLCNTCKNYLTK